MNFIYLLHFVAIALFLTTANVHAQSLSGLTTDLSHTNLVVVGLITSIEEPLLAPGCAANCHPYIHCTIKVTQKVMGKFHEDSFSLKEIYDWPTKIVPYAKGEVCLFVLMQDKNTNKVQGLLSVLPAGRGDWPSVSSRSELDALVKVRLEQEIRGSDPSERQAELLYLLSPMLSDTETEEFLRAYSASSNEWVRHAAA